MNSMIRKTCVSCSTKPAFWYKRDTNNLACRECAIKFNKEKPDYEGLPVCSPAIDGFRYTPHDTAADPRRASKMKPLTHFRKVIRLTSLSQMDWLIHYTTSFSTTPKITTTVPFHNWITEVEAIIEK